MAGFVRRLDGQDLEDFTKVWMDPSEESSRHDQRNQFVLDQIRHHLDHGRLDLRWEIVATGGLIEPVDQGGPQYDYKVGQVCH